MVLLFLVFLNINKYHLKILGVLLFVCLPLLGLFSQANSEWQGEWKGILTQGTGGYKSSYSVRLTLTKSSNEISGFFYVDEKGLTSKMSVKGQFISKNKIKIEDLKIIEHQVPANIDWCFKTYILEFKNINGRKTLEGTWTGKSLNAVCIPGKVMLKKPLPRA